MMKRVLLSLVVLVALLAGFFYVGPSANVSAQEPEGGAFTISFNPTGTHIHKGFLKVRVDLYPSPESKTYALHHIQVPVIPPEGYLGKVDELGSPVNIEDYNNWIDSLPKVWQLNPALCHFITISETTTPAELENYIHSIFDADTLASLDEFLTRPDSIHWVSPLMKGKAALSSQKIQETDGLIGSVNERFKTLAIQSEGGGEIIDIEPKSIDVGDAATERTSYFHATNTIVNKGNPANATGSIDTVEVWLSADTVTFAVAAFYVVSGNNLSTRGYDEDIGVVVGGSKQTCSGLSISIETGDYIGTHYTVGGEENQGVRQDNDGGAGIWYEASTDYIPCTNEEFNSYNDYQISLYGTGTEAGGVVAPTVVTNAAISVEETTATLSGNITATGGANCTDRGFQWDIDTGVPYADNWTEAGNFGVGNFTHGLTSLTEGELYYYRAGANNTAGWGWGAEVTFLTKPVEPDTLVATGGYQQVNLSWNKGTGSDNTTITAKQGSYPANRADGTVVYDNTGTSANHTGLGDGEHWYYRAWSWCTEGGKTQYSDAYAQDDATTIGAPTVTNNGGATSITDTTARLRGEVTDTGGENPIVHIYWGLIDQSDNATAWTNDENLGALGSGVFYKDISALSADTIYFYRCSANNTAGTDWANSTANFTTLSPPPPPPPPSPGAPVVTQPPVEGERLSLIMAGCAVLFFSELGFWRRTPLLFMLAGGASLMLGFHWYHVYTTPTGLTIGLMLVAYSFVCIAFAFKYIFWREYKVEE